MGDDLVENFEIFVRKRNFQRPTVGPLDFSQSPNLVRLCQRRQLKNTTCQNVAKSFFLGASQPEVLRGPNSPPPCNEGLKFELGTFLMNLHLIKKVQVDLKKLGNSDAP